MPRHFIAAITVTTRTGCESTSVVHAEPQVGLLLEQQDVVFFVEQQEAVLVVEQQEGVACESLTGSRLAQHDAVLELFDAIASVLVEVCCLTRAIKNSGGVTPLRSAQANFSASVKQQQSSQQ